MSSGNLLSKQLWQRRLCKSQKDKVKGVTFLYINCNMKIVLHVPEEFWDDMDNSDVCSGR